VRTVLNSFTSVLIQVFVAIIVSKEAGRVAERIFRFAECPEREASSWPCGQKVFSITLDVDDHVEITAFQEFADVVLLTQFPTAPGRLFSSKN
jgi:hypothetical protein